MPWFVELTLKVIYSSRDRLVNVCAVFGDGKLSRTRRFRSREMCHVIYGICFGVETIASGNTDGQAAR